MARENVLFISSCSLQGSFLTHFRELVLIIVVDSSVTEKCKTAIKALFLYLNLCLNVMLNGLSCSFTFISYLTTNCSFT